MSTRIDLRLTLIVAVAVVLAALGLTVGVGSGDYPIAPLDVVKAMVGAGSEDVDFIIITLRLPRVLVALLVGVAFGLSGAIFQSLARNPLVSPDIIGINAGASLVAVAIIVRELPYALVPMGAFLGALATAIVIYVLSWKRGLSRFRLVLVGIGINAVLGSVISYLMVSSGDLENVHRATVWMVGSLFASDWADVRLIGVALAVLVPLALVLRRPLQALQLGDDTARGLGVHVERARLGLIVVGVGLAAVAVTVAGPIGFVAFIAPHIARRLSLTSGAAVFPAAAAIGAVLVLAADLVAQRGAVQVPVGVVTPLLGAPYFLYLLYRANRLGEAV